MDNHMEHVQEISEQVSYAIKADAGDPEVIKSKLKYQYKEKSGGDDTWKDIQDMKVLFNEHPQNKIISSESGLS